MLEPETVTAMLRLRGVGWGTRRIARELRVSRNTVRRYIETGGWRAYTQPRRRKTLDVMGTNRGYETGLSAIAGTPTSFARS